MVQIIMGKNDFNDVFNDISDSLVSNLYDALLKSIQLYGTEGFLFMVEDGSGEYLCVACKLDQHAEGFEYDDYIGLTTPTGYHITADTNQIGPAKGENEDGKLQELVDKKINEDNIYRLYQPEEKNIPYEDIYRFDLEGYTHFHKEREKELPSIYNCSMDKTSYSYLNVFDIELTTGDDIYVDDSAIEGVDIEFEDNKHGYDCHHYLTTPTNEYTLWNIELMVEDNIRMVSKHTDDIYDLSILDFINGVFVYNTILLVPREMKS
jgi:hypothetical protein